MLGFKYLKATPTTYILQYKNGQVVRQGAGLSFWYFRPTSVLASLSVSSIDVPFVFNEITADVQDATIQGDLTYRIVDPQKTASLLDFSVDHRGRHQSDDPEKLGERLVKLAQIRARAFSQRHQLADVLVKSDELVGEMLPLLQESSEVEKLGVEVLELSILSIQATPEMTKALQAQAREKLLQEADEAIHQRRNTAINLERQIKENELQTEIAIENKRRQVRETAIAADIAVEEQRAALVDQQVENERKESEARGHALRATLEPLKEIDWRTLVAASGGGADPKNLIAMAFRDLADNADKIGQLNVSPELLNTLLGTTQPPPQTQRKRKQND